MRRLVDPSLTEDLALSMDRKELGLVLSQHHMPLFDNVSQITDWMSNLFCTASTGSSTMEREYYTNEGVVIRFFRNVVGLNGIALAPRKADLLDRVLSIQLPGMRDEDRQVERILEERFEAMRPKLVGALFSSVSEALKQYPEVTIDELPRMAGFAVWGEAVARALGYEPGRFIEAYRRNRGEISEEVLARDPVGSSILLLLEGRDRWEGTPTELHEVLKRISRVASLHLTSFPGGAAALTRRIAEIIPNLDEEGVSITRPPRGKARLIILSRLRRVDDNDATSPIKKIGNSKGEIEESSSVSTAVTSEVADQ
jgi:hypothetical protein